MPRVTCPQCKKSQEAQDASLIDLGWAVGKLMLNPWKGFYEYTKGMYEAISREHIITKLCKCRYCNTLFSICPHCSKAHIIVDLYETSKTQKCLYCHREFQAALDGKIN